ncbi:Gfo/Idh/MocA family oxidoreductase [Ferruginibacter yonginensis]|uniref:Gfo/Idh/MocA family oxidoreductase n=1 Tax=Ferruginibacter yonginensis TaxID=1310416 RepID=A0ABV8QV04_9BACT
MINVAIIGFGLSGRYLQAPFFEANHAFELKTIVSNSQNPALFFPNVKVEKNIEAVLNDDGIDLVSICSPNETHFEYAKKVLLANKHVLVEKPFTATVEEATTLINIAKQQNKVIAIFQNRRFDSDFLTIQKIVQSNVLGSLVNVQIQYNRYKPLLNPKKWKETPAPSSGIIYDLGAHIIDQAIALFGEPLKVEGYTFTQRVNSSIDDAFDITLHYKTLKVQLRSSLLVKADTPRYILHGTEGSFIKYGIDVQEDQLKLGLQPTDDTFGVEPIIQKGSITTTINGIELQGTVTTEKGNWMLLFDNLANAINNNEPLIVAPAQVVAQIKIIEAIKQQCVPI